MKLKFIILSLAFLNFPFITVKAEPSKKIERISALRKNLKEVEKIYLHAGLASVITFPKPIISVRLGNPKSLKAEIAPELPNELTIRLLDQSVEPTNIIVKADTKFYIFDVIPSQNTHQDYLPVVGFYGSVSPIRKGMTAKERQPTSNQMKNLEVIRIGD